MYIAVDTGGTFTDIIALCDNNEIYLSKVLTVINEPWKNIADSIKNIAERCKDEEIYVFHATTIATNMLLGQKGLETAKTALLITKGFHDIVTIGRQNRPKLYDHFFEKPKQLVSKELIYEVEERVLPNGDVLIPIIEEEVDKIVRDAKLNGAESLAIVFINSYINPINEENTLKIAKRYFKYVVVSSLYSPFPREYERASTAIINASLTPKIEGYLSNLYSELSSYRIREFFVMSSSGGLLDWNEVVINPSLIIESGPAAGVIGASVLSSLLGIKKVVAFDMGGTTAKASSIVDGMVSLTSEYEVGGKSHYGRIIKGSGYPLRGSFIDLAEVSAGGGTIIWKDEAGAIKVGPQSVGSYPGPMCYGLGGEQPTITDANVALGRIPPGHISGGIKLNEKLALEGLSRIGDPFKVSSEAISLVNLEMGRAIRLVTVERGFDPSSFTLFAYGGGGPLHATGIAKELGMSRVLIPPLPGLFSSLGLFLSDYVLEASSFVDKELKKVFESLENKLKALLQRMNELNIRFHRFIEAKYKGQGWELLLKLPDDDYSIKDLFDEAHESVYGYSLEAEVEVSVAHLIATVDSPFRAKILSGVLERSSVLHKYCKTGYTKVLIDDSFESIPVYCRSDFDGDVGPVVIVDYGSTIFVDKGWRARKINLGALLLERD